jgi:hypothetical protein
MLLAVAASLADVVSGQTHGTVDLHKSRRRGFQLRSAWRGGIGTRDDCKGENGEGEAKNVTHLKLLKEGSFRTTVAATVLPS